MPPGHKGDSPETNRQHVAPLEPKDFLLVHLAEYSALTARGTNYITLGVAVCSIIPLYLAFVGAMWTYAISKPHGVSVLVWGSLLVIQVVFLFALQLQYEQYQIIVYIETALRCKVHRLTHSGNFWGYEGFLDEQRTPRHAATWWEQSASAGMFLFLVMIVLIFRYFKPLTKWDCLGIGGNFVRMILLFIKSRDAVKRRQKWQATS